jgi:galactose mutarotase-like enzyme
MSDSPVCELRAGALRAAVRPDLGASLAGLWWQDEPLLRSCEPGLLAGPRQSACFALLPYSNRIGHCRFDWRGAHHSTRANFGDHPHSLHGVGWQRAWTVTAHTPERLQLGLRHEPDADWPFAFSATQELQLSDDALVWRMSLRSCDGREQPAGLGWHPYFLHRAGSRLQTRVAGRWEPGEDALPCRRTELPGLRLHLRAAARASAPSWCAPLRAGLARRLLRHQGRRRPGPDRRTARRRSPHPLVRRLRRARRRRLPGAAAARDRRAWARSACWSTTPAATTATRWRT